MLEAKSTYRLVLKHHRKEKIQEIVNKKLPEKCREIFILSRIENKTNTEISIILISTPGIARPTQTPSPLLVNGQV